MVHYSAADLAKHLGRAKAQGIRLARAEGERHYLSTSAETVGRYYDVRVGEDLEHAECSCPATECCKHSAAALSAARMATLKEAGRTLRKAQDWQRQMAAVA